MLSVALRSGHAFLTMVGKHGTAGDTEKMQRKKREKKKMSENYSKSKEKPNDKSQRKSKGMESRMVTAGEVILKPATMTGSSIDMVNHPPHYASSKIECIDAMEAMTSQNREYKNPLTGHEQYCWQVIFKYIWRFPFKENAVEDLKKAKFYLERLIKSLENKK